MSEILMACFWPLRRHAAPLCITSFNFILARICLKPVSAKNGVDGHSYTLAGRQGMLHDRFRLLRRLPSLCEIEFDGFDLDNLVVNLQMFVLFHQLMVLEWQCLRGLDEVKHFLSIKAIQVVELPQVFVQSVCWRWLAIFGLIEDFSMLNNWIIAVSLRG